MQDYDTLGRASLIIVKSKHPKMPKRFHLIGTAHVTHPWEFPKLFPEHKNLLSSVNEESTKNYMEIRDLKDGTEIDRFQLDQNCFIHPKLDLVVTHIKEENMFLQKCIEIAECEKKIEIVELNSKGLDQNDVRTKPTM